MIQKARRLSPTFPWRSSHTLFSAGSGHIPLSPVLLLREVFPHLFPQSCPSFPSLKSQCVLVSVPRGLHSQCPDSPFRWMGLSMISNYPFLLGHNRLKDLLAGKVDSRTIETSRGYRAGQHASNYRGSITWKASGHKGREGKLRIGWVGQLGWAGRWERHLPSRKLRKKYKQ